jgi:uncharacterized membrane protein
VKAGDLLRAGVIIAASVVAPGGIVYLVRHGAAAPHYRVFLGAPADLRGVSGIIADTLSFSGRGIIQSGLLLLAATPVARVIFSVAAFALQRNRTYIVIILIVLAVPGYSLLGGAMYVYVLPCRKIPPVCGHVPTHPDTRR